MDLDRPKTALLLPKNWKPIVDRTCGVVVGAPLIESCLRKKPASARQETRVEAFAAACSPAEQQTRVYTRAASEVVENRWVLLNCDRRVYTADCEMNAIFFRNFFLKMQKWWRKPLKSVISIEEMAFHCYRPPYRSWGRSRGRRRTWSGHKLDLSRPK